MQNVFPVITAVCRNSASWEPHSPSLSVLCGVFFCLCRVYNSKWIRNFVKIVSEFSQNCVANGYVEIGCIAIEINKKKIAMKINDYTK